MIDTNFSVTHELLNALNDYDCQVGKLNSFIVVHIAGGATTAITLALDTLLHLIACVTKVVTGIIATPYCYFMISARAENWTWSAAVDHFMQAAKYATGFLIVPPTTLFLSPQTALNLLFPEKAKLSRLQEELRSLREELNFVQDELNHEQQLNEHKVQPQVSESLEQDQDQETISYLQDELRKEQAAHQADVRRLETNLANRRDDAIQPQKKVAVLRQYNAEDDEHQELVNKLQEALTTADYNIQFLESQVRELNEKPFLSQNEIENLQCSNGTYRKLIENLNQKAQEKTSAFTKQQTLNKSLSKEIEKLNYINEVSLKKITELAEQLEKAEKKTFTATKQQAQNEALKEEIRNLKNLNEKNQKTLNIRFELINALTSENDQFKLKKSAAIPEGLDDAIEELYDLLACPITYELLTTAAFVVPCGHKFNRIGLNEHLEAKGACPSCIEPSKVSNIDHQTRDIAIKVEEIKKIMDHAKA